MEEGLRLNFDIDDLRHPAKFDAVNHTINGAELRFMVERVAAVREAIGPEVDPCIDLMRATTCSVPVALRGRWSGSTFCGWKTLFRQKMLRP